MKFWKSSNRNSQKRTQSTHSATESNPYRDAQLVDIGIAERAFRANDSLRRQNTIQGFSLLIALLALAILATKDHTQAIVYHEDAKNGTITYMGVAGVDTTLALNTVEKQLGLWIEYVRDISSDPDFNRRSRNEAMIMVAKGSQAQNSLSIFFDQNDPTKLGKSIHRIVTRQAVNRITDISYQVVWTEQTTDADGNSTQASYQGTVTLQAVPQANSDSVLGPANPAGVYIAQYDLKV